MMANDHQEFNEGKPLVACTHRRSDVQSGCTKRTKRVPSDVTTSMEAHRRRWSQEGRLAAMVLRASPCRPAIYQSGRRRIL